MPRIADRIKRQQQRRQACINAVLHADPSTITRLHSMATTPKRVAASKRQQYQLGLRDGIHNQRNHANRNPDYQAGFIAGRSSADAPAGKYGPDGPWRQVMAQRQAKAPDGGEIRQELQQRQRSDDLAKADRQASTLLSALRNSQA